MSSLTLTDEERTIAREIQPRAAELRNLLQSYDATALELITLARFLLAWDDHPGMLYAFALTAEAYETLTSLPLPVKPIEKPESET